MSTDADRTSIETVDYPPLRPGPMTRRTLIVLLASRHIGIEFVREYCRHDSDAAAEIEQAAEQLRRRPGALPPRPDAPLVRIGPGGDFISDYPKR